MLLTDASNLFKKTKINSFNAFYETEGKLQTQKKWCCLREILIP